VIQIARDYLVHPVKEVRYKIYKIALQRLALRQELMTTKGPTSNFLIKFFFRREILDTVFTTLLASFPDEGHQTPNDNTDIVLKFIMKLFEEASLHQRAEFKHHLPTLQALLPSYEGQARYLIESTEDVLSSL
jgi:hypothetical protein